MDGYNWHRAKSINYDNELDMLIGLHMHADWSYLIYNPLLNTAILLKFNTQNICNTIISYFMLQVAVA